MPVARLRLLVGGAKSSGASARLTVLHCVWGGVWRVVTKVRRGARKARTRTKRAAKRDVLGCNSRHRSLKTNLALSSRLLEQEALLLLELLVAFEWSFGPRNKITFG
jgi:hypothetical protein